mgnify:FL=1
MYRGRIAPTPSGLLHLGHAKTFWTAHQRAREQNGTLFYRNEDLDPDRCKQDFTNAAMKDLQWLGISWDGDLVQQSSRLPLYQDAFEKLCAGGHLFPCDCSRRDIREAATAPHAEDGDPIYPGTCREKNTSTLFSQDSTKINWRFRVPQGEVIEFTDNAQGVRHYKVGTDFGDFPVWQKNGIPAYQLAVVVDDAEMEITEVVRGEDLLLSTARQLLLYRALNLEPPQFYHCPLITDENGERLAKRHKALSLRALRQNGRRPNEILA